MSRERSDEIDELNTALSAAQAEFTAIPKDATNPFFKSKYADLPKVVEVASPILTKHGLAVSQFPGIDDAGFDTLTTWLLHKSGQFLCESMRLRMSKEDAQGQGSGITYARRYAYMAALGLVADVDDDGNTASQPGNGGARAQRVSARVPPAPRLEPLSDHARETVLKAIEEAGQPVPLTLRAVGLDEPAGMTKVHAQRIKALLDGIAEQAEHAS